MTQRAAVLALPILAAMLNSCAISMSLAVANRTEGSIAIDFGKANARLWPDREQVFREWPDDRIITITTDKCVRTFNVDEDYSPANEWRFSQYEIVRRYAVYGDGFLKIVMPDKAHSSSEHLKKPAPAPARLELTPLSERCSA